MFQTSSYTPKVVLMSGDGGINSPCCGHHITVCIHMYHTVPLNIHVCQLHLNKAGQNKAGEKKIEAGLPWWSSG